MVSAEQATTTYTEQFDQRQAGRDGMNGSWLRRLCDEAFSRFTALGFPTLRDEEWRFTNVEPIASGNFKFLEDGRTALGADELRPFAFPGLSGTLLVFVEGRFAPELSTRPDLPDGVKVVSMAEAHQGDGELLQSHLARYADYQQDAFAALNTAFMTDGAFVYVPQGRIVKEPIQLLFVSTARSEGTHTYPRNLIVAEANSQATIVEHYVATHDCRYFTNSVTEVVVGENASVDHYLIERESSSAMNVSTLRIQQLRSSRFTSHSVLLGGALVRNNIHPVLDGEGCYSLLNGLYILNGRQHIDNHMLVEHAKPHGDSRQFYKGILDGRSRAVFGGRIIVHQDAQKTDAKQTNINLLLSNEAQIDTKPQLEIYADDVKCTHGATVGQMEAEAIFYLRSRGLSEDAARGLIVYAFVRESLERMNVDPIRRGLEPVIFSRMPQTQSLEGLA